MNKTQFLKGLATTVAMGGAIVTVGNKVSADVVTDTTATAQPTTQTVAQPTAVAPVETATNATVPVVTTTSGNTTIVDTTDRQTAVADAKNAGVTVNTVKTPIELGTATTVAEETALQNQAKAAIDKETAHVKEVKANYESQLAEQQKNLGQTGYTNEVIKQSLNFESEANANLAVSGDMKFVDPSKAWDMSVDFQNRVINALANEVVKDPNKYVTWEGSDQVLSKAVTLEVGKSVKATYTNLKNSTYAGKPISRVEITYTNAESTEKELLFIAKDPTKGFIVYNHGTESTKLDVVMRFFDADGNQVAFTKENPATIALSSLNSHALADGSVITTSGEHVNQESIKNYNFHFVGINGSKITENADGIYSKTSTDYKSEGSTYNNSEWDQSNNPLFYYGSGVGVLTSGNTISFRSENMRTTNSPYAKGQWLAINSKVATPSVVTNPVATVNTYVYDKVGDVTTVHVTDTGVVLIPKTTTVDNQPIGSSYDVSKHETKITTKDGKTYTFVGVTPNAKGTVELGTKDVVFTYKEVFGTVTVGYKDTTGKIIKDPIVDTPTTSTGEPYDTTDNKPHVIKTDDGKTYLIVPGLTVGNETGKVKEGDTHVDYIYNELTVEKGVINEAGKDVNDGTIVTGEKAHYTLTGASVVASAFNDGKGQYAFEDDLDEAHDKYLGSHLILVKDITLEDGTVIKSGSDLMKYAQEQYDGNIYKISLNSDFLKSIADKDELQVQAIIDFERIASGEVNNTFQNIINGEVVNSNTVKTTTPENPVTPKTPAKPTAYTPVAKAGVGATLPKTGDNSNALLSAMGILSLVSVAFVAKKKQN